MTSMFNAYLASKHSECSKIKVGCCLEIYVGSKQNVENKYHCLFFTGYNSSPNAPNFCPRNLVHAGPGERYDLCTDICLQKFHAEEQAIDTMLEYINERNGTIGGSTNEDVDDVDDLINDLMDDCGPSNLNMVAYVYGIDRLCDRCKGMLTKFGFTIVWICKDYCDIFNTNKWKKIVLEGK